MIVRNGQALSNGGTIINTVSAAIGGDISTIANAAGGRIAGSGGTAIAANTGLNLTNAGRVEGDVTIASTAPFAGPSTIDSTAGTIAGNVNLAAGSDTVVARYASGALVTGITGTIDGGAGIDTLRVRFDADATVTAPIALPASFERLALAPVVNVTATLGSGFSTTGTILLVGPGTVVNRGALQGTDQVIMDEFGSYPRFSNEGTIRSTAAGADLYAITLNSAVSFANAGSISAAANGVSFRSQQSFSNSGTITAAGTGLNLFGGTVTNSGTLRSTAGVALDQTASQTTNTGTIEGAAAGASLFTGTIVNSGRIAATSGIGVQLQAGGLLDNRAGGVVSGTTAAVGPAPGSSNSLTGAVVSNAGTINGNVTLGNGASSITNGNNRFFALPGGVLNGNLSLGSGDYLITQTANAGPTQFAGINGTVTANNSNLRYQVRSDATAIYAPVAGFQSIGFELFDGAKLTLSSSGIAAPPATFAGSGSVNLTATIAATSAPAISVTSLLTATGFNGGVIDVSVISRGDLSLVHTDQSSYPYAAVAFGGSGSFTNAGTITVREQASTVYSSIGAIAGGTIVNSGTISLSGAIGVRGASQLTNTGSVVQIAGGSAATGVSDVATVVNSGTIQVGGIAITNSDYTYSPTAITNAAGGTIAGGGGTAVRVYSGSFINAGTVVGTVDLNYATFSYDGLPHRTTSSSSYIAAGGTIAGDLLFGQGSDLFLQTGDTTGVSGKIDAGGGFGTDIFGRGFTASGTVAIEALTVPTFEDALIQATGRDTTVTLTGTTTFAGNLYATGDGSVVSQAAIGGSLRLEQPYLFNTAQDPAAPVLAAFTNSGSIAGSVSGSATSFTNSGSIGTASAGSRIDLYKDGALSFTNSGQITTSQDTYFSYGYPGTTLSGTDVVTLDNSGSMAGGAGVAGYFQSTTVAGRVSVTNSGTIGGSTDSQALQVGGYADGGSGALSVTNSGTITATSVASAPSYSFTTGVFVQGSDTVATSIVNTATGTIRATGPIAFGVNVYDSALTLDNAGVIAASGTRSSTAVASSGDFANTIRNTGSITGVVAVGAGADTIENSGTITGNVFLGGGDDRFVQQGPGIVVGVIDGGAGTDAFVVDSTGDGAIAGGQFVNFERLNQVGTGTVRYSGRFAVNTIALDGGTLAVAAGQTLSTLGGVTVSSASDSVAVVNAGTIAGSVRFGAGDNSYTEGAGSSVAGPVDGGAGNDIYRVALSGDRTGIGTRTNFERLGVEGSGTLSLTLDQSFQSVALAAPGLSLALGGYTVGRIDGDDTASSVTLDGDVAAVALGGGDDTLSLAGTTAAGRYDGGAGNDTLRLRATGPVTLTGSIGGFETIALAQAGLTIAGTLGTAGGRTSFGDGAQALTIASGGTIAGTIDLGGGDDSLRIAAGGTIAGTVAGGAGTDAATVELAGDRTLAATALTGFERLATEGSGTLTLAGGAFAFDQVSGSSGLTVAADSMLTTPQLAFGAADNRLLIAGGFAGSVDGGAGSDSIDVFGGSATASVTFGTIANVEALRMSGGLATLSGTASFSSVALGGGRLVGLAGSALTAPTISVAAPATFGSAGIVTGNLAVSGTLSPGASPGTMTVNGNVALASGSVSLFEITPTVSDKLLVNGNVTIAGGATLQLMPTGTIIPGTVLDLIVASGGITGSFTNVVKPATLFGFVVQDASRVRLFGAFLNNEAYSPQVSRSIDYVNGVLTSGRASAALLAAAPSLVTASGASNPASFAQLTPEVYASARQIAVENGLSAVDAARGPLFAPAREEAGAFAFASGIAATRTLDGDAARGTATARIDGYGFFGGLGWGSAARSLGAFVGYQNDRQRLASLGARTDADGVIAGVQARMAYPTGFGARLTVAYTSGNAHTMRALTGGNVRSHYDLKSWTADVAVDHAVSLGADWAVRPGVGATVIRSTRGAVAESGNAAFGLSVGRDRDTAVFVDGGLTFSGTAEAGSAQVRPHLALGIRYQAGGRGSAAIGALGGGVAGLVAEGAERAPVVATAALEVDVALSRRLTLFGAISGESGDADHRGSARAGLSLGF